LANRLEFGSGFTREELIALHGQLDVMVKDWEAEGRGESPFPKTI